MALGFGFRCGFLGLLHMEIIQERIRREHDVDIISTYPSVIYQVTKQGGENLEVDNPVNLPDPGTILEIREPTIKAALHIPNDSMGDILAMIMEKRGTVEQTETLDGTRVVLTACCRSMRFSLISTTASRASRTAMARWIMNWESTAPPIW